MKKLAKTHLQEIEAAAVKNFVGGLKFLQDHGGSIKFRPDDSGEVIVALTAPSKVSKTVTVNCAFEVKSDVCDKDIFPHYIASAILSIIRRGFGMEQYYDSWAEDEQLFLATDDQEATSFKVDGRDILMTREEFYTRYSVFAIGA